jgi:hypothetical protein
MAKVSIELSLKDVLEFSVGYSTVHSANDYQFYGYNVDGAYLEFNTSLEMILAKKVFEANNLKVAECHDAYDETECYVIVVEIPGLDYRLFVEENSRNGHTLKQFTEFMLAN